MPDFSEVSLPVSVSASDRSSNPHSKVTRHDFGVVLLEGVLFKRDGFIMKAKGRMNRSGGASLFVDRLGFLFKVIGAGQNPSPSNSSCCQTTQENFGSTT